MIFGLVILGILQITGYQPQTITDYFNTTASENSLRTNKLDMKDVLRIQREKYYQRILPNFFHSEPTNPSPNVMYYYSDYGDGKPLQKESYTFVDGYSKNHLNQTRNGNSNRLTREAEHPKVAGWRHFVFGGNFTNVPNEIQHTLLQDGSLEVRFNEIPATCVLGNIRKNFSGQNLCTLAMVTSKLFVTSGGCTAGLSTMGGDLGFWVNCGINVEKTMPYTTRDINQFFNYGSYTNLNMSRLRKYALSVVEVLTPFKASDTEGKTGVVEHWWGIGNNPGTPMLPKINYPPMPNFTTHKREVEMYTFYNTCYIYTRNASAGASSWHHVMLQADLVSNEKCRKYNVRVENDEFCLLIVSKRNGPCSLLLGGPVVCGAGVLEGVLSYDTNYRCNKRNRIFIATRVDMYMDYLYRITNLPQIQGTEAPGYVKESERPFLAIGETVIDTTVLLIAGGVSLATLLLALILFLIFVCRCKKLKPKPPNIRLAAAFTISINAVLPWLLIISNMILYLRLRESVEREIKAKKPQDKRVLCSQEYKL